MKIKTFFVELSIYTSKVLMGFVEKEYITSYLVKST